jgi:hypothetical protein
MLALVQEESVMTREQSHKGSGHPRKQQETQEGRNDRRQNDGSNQQIINEEEEREGKKLDERPQQGERSSPREATETPRTADETSAGH